MSLRTSAIYDTATLGGLIAELERMPRDADVQFDFCYLRPTKVDSYRGYYDHLALGWSDKSDGDRHWPPVSKVLAELKAAVGATFAGWKGGEYTMSENTPVWVANPGQTGGTGIVGVEREGESTIVLVTRKVD